MKLPILSGRNLHFNYLLLNYFNIFNIIFSFSYFPNQQPRVCKFNSTFILMGIVDLLVGIVMQLMKCMYNPEALMVPRG